MVSIQGKIPLWLFPLSKIFRSEGIPLYIVGGFIRNSILGIPESDFDITGPAEPKEVIKLLQGKTNIKVVPKAVAFGTVEIHIFFQGNTFISEYTSFRKDIYREGSGHLPEKVQFTASLQEDALRRDFSINSIYYDVENDQLVDPVHGLRDLRDQIIRTATQDPELIFKDDGLRILRMIRFACQLNFSIHRQTYESAKANIALLCNISKERIRDEFVKILLSDIQYPTLVNERDSLRKGLYYLKDIGAFQYILPELLKGIGVMQRKDFHRYSVFHHNIETCIETPPVLHLRLAGLCHDIAKPFLQKSTGKMYLHEKAGGEMVKEMLGQRGLKFDKKLVSKVANLVENHMFDVDNKAKAVTVRKKFAALGKDTVLDLIQLRQADQNASGKEKTKNGSVEKWKEILSEMERKGVPGSMDDLKITGQDIMKLLDENPSKRIGEIKRKLFDWVVEHPEDNNLEILKRIVIEWHKN